MTQGPPLPSAPSLGALERASAAPQGVWISLADPHDLEQRLAALERTGPDGRPLHGLPFAVKDNIDVAGMETTAACPAYAYEPPRSATAVELLIAAGALPVGKTNMDQFATGLAGMRTPYGSCASAFDSHYVSGGSSSGSALAVAEGTVPLALGTDTAGSGRVPAALNGIVGLKPTRGLISTAGVVPACRSLDCVSIFAADAAAARVALSVVAGFDPRDPYSRRALSPLPRPADMPIRVGVPPIGELDLDERCHGAWACAIESAAGIGMEIVRVSIEPLLEVATLLYDGPWLAERYAAVGDFVAEHRGKVDPVVAELILGGARWSAADVFRGQERLAALTGRVAPMWDSVDVLLMPTIPGPITPAEVLRDPFDSNRRLGTYTNFVNLLDLCAVAVPSGLDDEGMTFGVSLMAPAFGDELLLDIAEQWPSNGGHIREAAGRVAASGPYTPAA